MKQEYGLGDVCEFDWGEVKLIIKNKQKTYQMAAFTSAKSNYRGASLYNNQKKENYLDSHVKFFENVKGAYRTMVYDNMKVAVKRFIGKNEKEPTEDLLKLSIYYGFKFRFCNVRAGNEKGHVERSIDYIRRKVFGKKHEFDSLKEAQDFLDAELLKLNSRSRPYNNNKSSLDLLKEEQPYLLPKMPKYDTARVCDLRVDKYSTITVDGNHYSVPDIYVGEFIFTKIYSSYINCYYQGEKIAHHERKYGHFEWSIKIEHYTRTLKKKPGSLAGSTALKQAKPELKKIYNNYYIKKEKEFIHLYQKRKGIYTSIGTNSRKKFKRNTKFNKSTRKNKPDRHNNRKNKSNLQ